LLMPVFYGAVYKEMLPNTLSLFLSLIIRNTLKY